MVWVLLRTGLLLGTVVALGWLLVYAADLELQLVDKNCWIEIFRDENLYEDDPHLRSQKSKEFSTVDNLTGKDKDWSHDFERVIIVGSNAKVRPHEAKDFKGTEMAFAPRQQIANRGKLDIANDIESLKITCGPS